ncbi:histonelysine Nmethyltransferase SETMARlike [Trichonephila clavipes]|uniref:Histonelysine Nmethyltransferase SETMARlike n=1 Tax=Trichonephila clavipes TaxID=2585209 RepID=A0A8X6S4J5_TRICX|nr:histonelysine Nmethyltransferase SETMARlike [Trichonephila clavipes]
MTSQRYIDEVLLPHVRLFRGAVGDKFVFMDDNATCHRTLAVQDCLDSEGIQRLVWPARSPDPNRIENVWDALGRQVAGRNYPPTNKNTLIRALTEEWDKLPQQLLDNVVQTAPRTGRPVIENVDKITETIEVDRPVSSRSIAQKLTIDHKTVLSHLRKVGFKRKLHVWVQHQLTPKNMMDRISLCEALAKRNEIDPFLKRMVTGDEKCVCVGHILQYYAKTILVKVR